MKESLIFFNPFAILLRSQRCELCEFLWHHYACSTEKTFLQYFLETRFRISRKARINVSSLLVEMLVAHVHMHVWAVMTIIRLQWVKHNFNSLRTVNYFENVNTFMSLTIQYPLQYELIRACTHFRPKEIRKLTIPNNSMVKLETFFKYGSL